MHKCHMATLDDIPLFDGVSQEVRNCLVSKAYVRTYNRGMTIGLQREPVKTLKIVLEGWVKLYRVSHNGSEAVLATLKKGQSFDEVAALRQELRRTSADAVSDCTLLHLDISKINGCKNARQEISFAVLSAASGHLDDMMGHVEQLKVKNGAQRLSDFLVGLSDAQKGARNVMLPYDKTLVAGKLGMKPESLSRAFGRLRTLGVKSNLREVCIEDISILRDFAQIEPAYASAVA